MKKISILLSMLMIVGVFSTVASAAITTDAAVTLTADKTTVANGETVTITVAMTGDTSGYQYLGTTKVVPAWDVADFEFVEAETDSSTGHELGLSNDPGIALGNAASGNITFTQKFILGDEDYTCDFQFGTFTLKAISETAKTSEISLKTSTDVKVGTSNTNRTSANETAKVAIAITAAGPVGPTTVTTDANFVENAVAGSEEVYIEDSDAAVAYWAEGAFTQGKSSAYWTANFGTAAKKYELGSLPNLDGNVKLGIVITGATDVSAVKLNVVTQ